MHFADGPTERVIDQSPLPLPVAAGMYGSTGVRCVECRFAEPEINGVSG
jgi:hypothetical protein